MTAVIITHDIAGPGILMARDWPSESMSATGGKRTLRKQPEHRDDEACAPRNPRSCWSNSADQRAVADRPWAVAVATDLLGRDDKKPTTDCEDYAHKVTHAGTVPYGPQVRN